MDMSALEEHRETLEHHEFMMGKARGRLAVTLDLLTDALVLVGQHTVYTQSNAKKKKLPNDIKMIIKGIEQSKELIFSAMEEIKAERDKARLEGASGNGSSNTTD
jgi:hypothetical protein